MLIRHSWVFLLTVMAVSAARGDGDSASSLPLGIQPFHTGGGFKSDIPFAGGLQPLVEALRSPQFRIRDQATQTLLHLKPQRLSELTEALARETDPEAATRLTQVAAHLFLKNMTPLQGHASLLGIKLNLDLVHPDLEKPDALRMSVAVAELQPGYPAAQDLRVGDRLLAMDGKPFPIDMAIDDFRSQVMTRPPGSIVRFTLIRDGHQIDVGVQLAGLPEVPGAQPGVVNMTSIESAIDQRNEALAQFLAGLKTSVKEAPLVVADNSPPGGQMDNILQGNGGAIINNGGAIINNGGLIIINGGNILVPVPAQGK